MSEDRSRIGHYALALAELAIASEALDRIEGEARALRPQLDGSPELRRFLASLTVKDEGKRAALDQLLGDQLHPALMQFLFLLAGRESLDAIQAILEAFLAEVAARREQTAGEIVSALPLDAATVAQIEAETSRLLHKRVRLHPRVDPEMLGGVIVRAADTVFDGSVDFHLEALRTALLK